MQNSQVPACQIRNNVLLLFQHRTPNVTPIAKDVLLWKISKTPGCTDIPQHKKVSVCAVLLLISQHISAKLNGILDVQICALDAGFHRTSESQLLSHGQIVTFIKSSKYPNSIDS